MSSSIRQVFEYVEARWSEGEMDTCTEAGDLDRWIDNIFGAETAADVLT